MKKSGKKTDAKSWLVSHNEQPRFTCLFEDRKFHYSRTITGLVDPAGSPEEIQLLREFKNGSHAAIWTK